MRLPLDSASLRARTDMSSRDGVDLFAELPPGGAKLGRTCHSRQRARRKLIAQGVPTIGAEKGNGGRHDRLAAGWCR